MLHPSDAKIRERPGTVKPVSLTAPPRLSAPVKIDALLPVTVKDSVVHTIDAAAPPVVMTRLPSPDAILPNGQRDASACLKVESDGSHWGFRNGCGYSVQFSYCTWHGSEPLAACDSADSHAMERRKNESAPDRAGAPFITTFGSPLSADRPSGEAETGTY